MNPEPNVEQDNNSSKGEMSFGEHLEELRKHFIRSIIAIIVFAIVAFLFKKILFDVVILGPRSNHFITNVLLCKFAEITDFQSMCINQKEFSIINIDLAGQFKAHLLVSLIAGLMIAFPYFIYQLWLFIKPALGKKQMGYGKGLIGWISLLFTIGVLFGYFIIVPLAINFLATYSISNELVNFINFSSYLTIITTISLSTGLIFELPILIYFLAKIGIIGPKTMKKYRKHAIVVSLIAAGILTPPDVFSQILVAVPMIFLYELSIGIAKRVQRKRKILEAESEEI